MSNLSPERARELLQQMRQTAAGTTGREMHVCVNSGDLEDLLEHFSSEVWPADGLVGQPARTAACQIQRSTE